MQISFIFNGHLRNWKLDRLCIINNSHFIILLNNVSFQNLINICADFTRLKYEFLFLIQFWVIRYVGINWLYFIFVLLQIGVFWLMHQMRLLMHRSKTLFKIFTLLLKSQLFLLQLFQILQILVKIQIVIHFFHLRHSLNLIQHILGSWVQHTHYILLLLFLLRIISIIFLLNSRHRALLSLPQSFDKLLLGLKHSLLDIFEFVLARGRLFLDYSAVHWFWSRFGFSLLNDILIFLWKNSLLQRFLFCPPFFFCLKSIFTD